MPTEVARDTNRQKKQNKQKKHPALQPNENNTANRIKTEMRLKTEDSSLDVNYSVGSPPQSPSPDYIILDICQ